MDMFPTKNIRKAKEEHRNLSLPASTKTPDPGNKNSLSCQIQHNPTFPFMQSIESGSLFVVPVSTRSILDRQRKHEKSYMRVSASTRAGAAQEYPPAKIDLHGAIRV